LVKWLQLENSGYLSFAVGERSLCFDIKEISELVSEKNYVTRSFMNYVHDLGLL
jgi:hypothetical protein